MKAPTLQNALALFVWPVKKWRIIAAALTCIGILHIGATLAVSHVVTSSAIDRLKASLATNQMEYLPALTPDKQLIPFMSADVLYAICHFNTRKTSVQVTAYLPNAGWSLTVYGANGVSLYSAAGQAERPITINLKLVTSGSRFSGLTPEALGVVSRQVKQQSVESKKGLIIIRAPDRGQAYRRKTELDIEKSTCYATDR